MSENAREKEIDISAKIKRTIKFGLPLLLLLSIAAATAVWYAMYGSGDLVVRNAKVSGEMVAARTRVSGNIEEILVEDGAEVKAGDIIARIKANVTEEELKQLQQTLELSKRNLDQLSQGTVVRTPRTVTTPASGGASSAEIEKARSRMERMNQLYEMGAVSAVKRDQAAAEYQALAAAGPASGGETSVVYDTTVQQTSPEVLKKAEQQVKQAQAALELAQNSAAGVDIVAPVDGIAYLNDLAVGSEFKTGDTILNIGTQDNLWLEAVLTPEQAAQVRLGQAVDYYLNRTKFAGVVTEISEENLGGDEETPALTNYLVKVAVEPAAAANVRLGEAAEIRFLNKG